MFFYLVMGGVLLFTRRLLWLSVVFGFLVAAGWMNRPVDLYAVFYTSPLLLLFVSGALIAYWTHGRTLPAPLALMIVGVSCVLCAVLHAKSWPHLYNVALQAVGFGGIVLSLMSLEARGRLRVPSVILALGDSSYSLYLTHMLLYALLAKLLHMAGLASHMLYLVPVLVLCSMTAAHCVYLLLEKPMTVSLNVALGVRPRPALS